MIQIFKNWHLPRHLEIVCFLIIGILLQILDGSPFTMKERWQVVWDTDLPRNHFNPFVQKCIKTLLSVIVTVRCTTTYAYVVSAMLVIFCIFKRTAPKLMSLWLLVACIKPISTIFLEGLIGVYVCSAFGKIRKACVEFFIVKAMELIFSTYLWGNVLTIYKEIEKDLEQQKSRKEEDLLFKKHDIRRLRARSLIDESTLSKTTWYNNFERRDVPMIILQMIKRDEEMSDDSLLAPGMMLASVSNLGSFENIKTSQSLGELGFTDLTNAEVFGIEDNENLSKQEKVLRFLKLTRSEVQNIILNKSSVGNEIYNVGDDIWKRVMTGGMQVKQPKQPRTEIFIRTISPMDLTDEGAQQQEREALPFRSILSILISDKKGKEEMEDEYDKEDVTSQDEDENDDHIFMSNLKDGGTINRIKVGGSTFMKIRGREYARLYKKDFMTTIGPEVFDKASKLQKLTSLSKIRAITSRSPRSSPDLSRKKSRRLTRTLEQENNIPGNGYYERKDSVKPHLADDQLNEDKANVGPPWLDYYYHPQFYYGTFQELNHLLCLNFRALFLRVLDENPQHITSISSKLVKKSDSEFKQVSEMAIHFAPLKAKNSKSEDIEPSDMRAKDEEAASVNSKNKGKSEVKLDVRKAPELNEEDRTEKKTEEKSPQIKLAEEKPREVKQVEEKPAEPKLVEEKPPELKQVEEKPTKLSLVEEKSSEPKLKHKKSNQMKHKTSAGKESLTSNASVQERTLSKEAGSVHLLESIIGVSENSEIKKPSPTSKNRRILIRWVGQNKPKFLFRNRLSGNRSPSDDSDSVTEPPPKPAPEPKAKDCEEPPDRKGDKSDDSDKVKPKKLKEVESHQAYFVSEIFKKPLFDVLSNYYDLKRRVYLKGHTRHHKDKLGFSKLTRGKSRLREAEKLLKGLDLEPRGEKSWKSEVLKRSELSSQEFPTSSVSFLNIFNKRAAIKKLLVHEYKDLVQKYNRSNDTKADDFGFTSPDENNAETASDDSENSSRTESDTNTSTTDSTESGFLQGLPSNQPKESASEVPNPEVQSSDRPYAEEGDNPASTTGTAKPKTGPGLETKAFHALPKEEGQLLSSQESDEPISLYYSKAANLASPLLDMKGFIYPDHIHYSYKHVKKRGFDVDINRGFPLLMRGGLAMGCTRAKVEHKWEGKKQDCEITRRPMDLSFATTNAFAEWNSADQNDLDSITSETILAAASDDSAGEINSETDLIPNIQIKGRNGSVERRDNRQATKNDFKRAKPKSQEQNDLKYLYQSKDSALIEKLLKMHRKLNAEEYRGSKDSQASASGQRSPILISPTRLQSNKGRLSSSYKPAVVLQENRSSSERRKSEAQNERIKDMLAKLEREAVLQRRVLKSFQQPRKP